MYATPDQQRRAAYPRPAAGSPFTATPTETRHSANAARRAALAPPATPLARVLHAERAPTASPRRIRHRSWTTRLRDWPSNALLSLETSFQLVSFDAVGYPLGATLHLVHLAVRLPAFYAALPAFSDWWQASSSSAPSRYHPRAAPTTADARLEALLQSQAAAGKGWWSTLTWWFSIVLIVLSFANVAYLVTRRRKYQMVLRRVSLPRPSRRRFHGGSFSNNDIPRARIRSRLRMPNKPCSDSHPTKPTLSPLGPKGSAGQCSNSSAGQSQPTKRRRPFPSKSWTSGFLITHCGPCDSLRAWLRFPRFSRSLNSHLLSQMLHRLYSPPVAVMYHLLSPSNFLPMLLCGVLFVAQVRCPRISPPGCLF